MLWFFCLMTIFIGSKTILKLETLLFIGTFKVFQNLTPIFRYLTLQFWVQNPECNYFFHFFDIQLETCALDLFSDFLPQFSPISLIQFFCQWFFSIDFSRLCFVNQKTGDFFNVHQLFYFIFKSLILFHGTWQTKRRKAVAGLLWFIGLHSFNYLWKCFGYVLGTIQIIRDSL